MVIGSTEADCEDAPIALCKAVRVCTILIEELQGATAFQAESPLVVFAESGFQLLAGGLFVEVTSLPQAAYQAQQDKASEAHEGSVNACTSYKLLGMVSRWAPGQFSYCAVVPRI